MSGLATQGSTRLLGILARLGSPFEGERAAAGLLAHQFIKKRGVGWPDLIQPALPPPEQPRSRSFDSYGPGGNGKSVFLNVLSGILGDYAKTSAMETFQAANNDRHPTDLAMLAGGVGW